MGCCRKSLILGCLARTLLDGRPSVQKESIAAVPEQNIIRFSDRGARLLHAPRRHSRSWVYWAQRELQANQGLRAAVSYCFEHRTPAALSSCRFIGCRRHSCLRCPIRDTGPAFWRLQCRRNVQSGIAESAVVVRILLPRLICFQVWLALTWVVTSSGGGTWPS